MPIWLLPRAGLLAACPSTRQKSPSVVWPSCWMTSASRSACLLSLNSSLSLSDLHSDCNTILVRSHHLGCRSSSLQMILVVYLGCRLPSCCQCVILAIDHLGLQCCITATCEDPIKLWPCFPDSQQAHFYSHTGQLHAIQCTSSDLGC